MEQEICGISIKKSLADYINSKEHKESTYRISSASIKEHHRNYGRYKWIEDMVGKDLRIVFTGLMDIYRYASTLFNFSELDDSKYFSLEFEDFTVYFILVSYNFRRTGRVAALIDAKIVHLPRKKGVVMDKIKYKLGIYDVSSEVYSILPELYYPKHKADIRMMISWMRIHKNLLSVRYVLDGKIFSTPSRTRMFERWEKHAKIIKGDDAEATTMMKHPETVFHPLNVFLSYTTMAQVIHWWDDFSQRHKDSYLLDMKEITQDTVDEFVCWQNNRYKILR